MTDYTKVFPRSSSLPPPESNEAKRFKEAKMAYINVKRDPNFIIRGELPNLAGNRKRPHDLTVVDSGAEVDVNPTPITTKGEGHAKKSASSKRSTTQKAAITKKKTAAKTTVNQKTSNNARASSDSARPAKKLKIENSKDAKASADSSNSRADEDSAMLDADLDDMNENDPGEEQRESGNAFANDDDNDIGEEQKGTELSHTANDKVDLVTPRLKRSDRIVNPQNPEDAKLIAKAGKASNDIYDSDEEDLPGPVKLVGKPELFRNVRWGDAAYDTTANWSDSKFVQFVPGRYERQDDGTVIDQKNKLLVKITQKNGDRHIFRNEPPVDWNCQEAISALNKRCVQQIRRHTQVRFRKNVVPYAREEREFILGSLNASAKPTKGWARFVHDFNKKFEGKTIAGVDGLRPQRSQSSLTKEIERFKKDYYLKGKVPVINTPKSRATKATAEN